MDKEDIKLIWTVLCQAVTVDALTNNLSLSNIIEQLTVNINLPIGVEKPKEINLPAQMVLAMYWKNLSGDKEFTTDGKVIFKDPSGLVLGENPFNLKFTNVGTTFRFFMNINGLKLTIPGDYTFSVAIKQPSQGEFVEAGNYSLRVEINKGVVSAKK